MKNSGCHGNQSKKKNKKSLHPKPLIGKHYYLQEFSLVRGLQNSLKYKNNPSKNMVFMGDSFSFYYSIEKNEFTKFLRLVQGRLLLFGRLLKSHYE